MLFEEFCNLDWLEQSELLEKLELTKLDDVLSLPALQQRISFVEWGALNVITDAKINYGTKSFYVKKGEQGRTGLLFKFNVYHLIENCFNNYEQFFLLSSSKGRVGKRSPISRLPNVLFYKVIELFITK